MNDGSAMPETPAAAAPVAEPVPASSASSSSTGSSAGSDERRGMAAVGYLGVFCLVPLFFAKDSAFAQYHAKQGFILAVIGVVLNLLSGVLWRVPFGGSFAMLLGVVLFVVSIMGVLHALKGEKFEIPVVSEWAAKVHF